MEISSQKFGDQPLKIQIVRKFYLSDQNWYPIHFLKETAVVRFELLRTKTKHFIFLDWWTAEMLNFIKFTRLLPGKVIKFMCRC